MSTQTKPPKSSSPSITRDPRWLAVVTRDRRADGRFFYSVATSGVYCRPSCGARLANPGNVAFHASGAAAEAAGFRPCMRCKPEDAQMPAPHETNAETNARSIRFALGTCSLGAVLVAASDAGVCAILLGADAAALVRDIERWFPEAARVAGDAGFERLIAKAIRAIETPNEPFDLPLDPRGTAFQRRVWRALAKIRPGKTASYADIAERIGAPRAVRAVAAACAANPLAVAIPCHRVIKRDGALAGYRWGLARKRALLAREASAA